MAHEQEESEFLYKSECPDCGSSDANAHYSDGHTHCFSCGVTKQGDSNGSPREAKPAAKGVIPMEDYQGTVEALRSRNLNAETCQKWGYHVGKIQGKWAQIANYRDTTGSIVAQKVRFQDKDFFTTGKIGKYLYGMWLWKDGGKKVVVTEGEIDALTVSQLQGHKWPVVSVPTGADGSRKAIAENIEWLLKFDEIILMFDMDDPGRDAMQECATLFPPGRCKIAELPLKDANECLLKGKGADVITAIWNAKTYRPDGLVNISEIRSRIKEKPEIGLPWFLPTLTKLTYGRRFGDVYTFGAGTGVGKTDLFTQQMAFDVTELQEKAGVVYLEQDVVETGKRIAGKMAGKRFHVPDDGWTEEELDQHLDTLGDSVTLYDSFGGTEWETVEAKIAYMAQALGIRLFYVDHLTALADPANEKESLEILMESVASLAKRLGIIVHLISHLSTPEGKPHEEGGRVMIRHFKGSRAIGFWSFFMFGLERNQQDPDPVRAQTTTFRILKDRFTGQATGKVIYLSYDAQTGLLSERVGYDPDGDDDQGDGATASSVGF
ncbi:DNA primase [Pseudomonas sp. HMWF032]|uniref:toprim domain-containing protein n=1 Tax=Pseudomonas sp. HMWF032 TaxID=2056866 RepID=UPI000D373E9D|nr:toprim domain-containing protein [Pseudomonas sp. HMWF032]PTS86459.1 DNA primase [Pseudomonas sp. HMWF032]PTT81352.1 DNA primase [Pseudomonas sp. HMWF010]